MTILYTAPTAIRAHMKWGPEYAERHDLSSLRLLGSVGEPINPEAWIWYREHIGGDRTPVVDTWWQTETGMMMITPLPGVTTLKPGSATKPFPGIDAAVVRRVGQRGRARRRRLPGPAAGRGRRCCAGIYGDPERYVETYWSRFPGVYFAGDGARIDDDGDFWLLGRVDDVMNVSGHRISTIEVESRARRPPGGGRGGRVRPERRADRAGDRRVRDAARAARRGRSRCWRSCATTSPQVIGPIAKPANIVFTPELPKTRSGKIMRRLLRDVAENRPLGDTTTLADPAVVEEIKTRAEAEPPRSELAPERQLGVDCSTGLALSESRETTTHGPRRTLAYHWGEAPECRPENRREASGRSRGCTRPRPGDRVWHAQRCLEWCEAAGVGDWDLAYAYEALGACVCGRGHGRSGRVECEARRQATRSRPEDREHFDEDFATL